MIGPFGGSGSIVTSSNFEDLPGPNQRLYEIRMWNHSSGNVEAIQCTFIGKKIERERPYPHNDLDCRAKHGQTAKSPWALATSQEEARREGVLCTLSGFEKVF